MEFKGTKDLAYWRANAEEDYTTTPISVLRYISELEKQKTSEMLEMLKYIFECKNEYGEINLDMHRVKDIEQLIKEATEVK